RPASWRRSIHPLSRQVRSLEVPKPWTRTTGLLTGSNLVLALGAVGAPAQERGQRGVGADEDDGRGRHRVAPAQLGWPLEPGEDAVPTLPDDHVRADDEDER